jgi:hypothetical protein
VSALRIASPPLYARVGWIAGFAWLLLAGCGAGGGVERAPPLPAAGSQRDDGSGVLYDLSTRKRLSSESAPDAGVASPTGGRGYGGYSYGGKGYGRYGGALYANYQFEANYASSDPPPGPYGADYTAIEVQGGGSITGKITASPGARVPRKLAAAKDVCPDEVPNASLLTDENGRVVGAVVYLEDIKKGRALPQNQQYGGPRMQLGGVVVRHGCRLSPNVQVMAPLGAVLTVQNQDAGDHSLRAERWEHKTSKWEQSFEVPLPARGSSAEVGVNREGFYVLRAKRGGDPAVAWVVATPHPYYAVTDANGEFKLDEVPPGRYSLVVWHPPLITGVGPDGEVTMTPPVVERRKVKVTSGHAATVAVRLSR